MASFSICQVAQLLPATSPVPSSAPPAPCMSQHETVTWTLQHRMASWTLKGLFPKVPEGSEIPLDLFFFSLSLSLCLNSRSFSARVRACVRGWVSLLSWTEQLSICYQVLQLLPKTRQTPGKWLQVRDTTHACWVLNTAPTCRLHLLCD